MRQTARNGDNVSGHTDQWGHHVTRAHISEHLVSVERESATDVLNANELHQIIFTAANGNTVLNVDFHQVGPDLWAYPKNVQLINEVRIQLASKSRPLEKRDHCLDSCSGQIDICTGRIKINFLRVTVSTEALRLIAANVDIGLAVQHQAYNLFIVLTRFSALRIQHNIDARILQAAR